jgi:hypothetical protein
MALAPIGGDRTVDVELRLELGDLGVDLLLALLAPCLLGGRDLGFDVGERQPEDCAVQLPDDGVEDLGALLVDHGDDCGVARAHGPRHLAEDRFGLVDVIQVEEGADQDAGRAAKQDPDRTAEDPDNQAPS